MFRWCQASLVLALTVSSTCPLATALAAPSQLSINHVSLKVDPSSKHVSFKGNHISSTHQDAETAVPSSQPNKFDQMMWLPAEWPTPTSLRSDYTKAAGTLQTSLGDVKGMWTDPTLPWVPSPGNQGIHVELPRMRAVLLNEIKDHTGSNIRDPLTEFALAIQNLDKSLPVSEALTGESDVPRFEMVDVARVSDNFETVHQRFVDVAMAASPPTQSSKTEIDSLFWFVEALDTMVGPDTHREPWIDWLPELDEQGLSKVALRQLAEIMKFNGLQVNRHHVLRLSIAYADLLKLCSKDDAVSEISEVHQLPHGYNMLSEYERYSVIVRASWLPREMTYQHRFESAMQAVLHARGLGESMVDLSPENFQSEMNRYVDEIASYYVSERERVRSDLSEFKNKNPDWPPASFTVNDYFSQLINAKLNRHFVDKTRQWLAPTKTSGHANRDAAENSRFISRQNPLRPVSREAAPTSGAGVLSTFHRFGHETDFVRLSKSLGR